MRFNRHDEEVAEVVRDAAGGGAVRNDNARDDQAPDDQARDDQAVSVFVERFADLLVQAGMPRMPSRVFVRLLATDEGRLTAADLAEQLQISPAAVSGAIRYLAQVDLVRRERPLGSRRDHYQVYDDTWHELLTQRDELMMHWANSLRFGVQALGESTPAGERISESIEFFEFLAAEMPALLDRWRAHKKPRPGDQSR